jgi:hypothetical protein
MNRESGELKDMATEQEAIVKGHASAEQMRELQKVEEQ